MHKLSMGLVGILLFVLASSVHAQFGSCTLHVDPQSLSYQGGSVTLRPSCELGIATFQLRRNGTLYGDVLDCNHGSCPDTSSSMPKTTEAGR
jgi:hypothetical protein